MSQYEDEGGDDHQEFDLNDPKFLAQLAEQIPDIDPDEIPRMSRPAPPADGVYWVKARLRADKAEPVYFKNIRKDPETGRFMCDAVVANLVCRIIDPTTGQEGAYLKDWYASTTTPKAAPGAPPKGSTLTAICKLAGKPIKPRASFPEIKAHVEQLFAEAGEDGIAVLVKTQWVKSVPKTVDIGGILSYAVKPGTNFRDYDEIKGEVKIRKQAAAQGIPDEMAHIWIEPVTGEERTVQAQVQSIEDPAKYQLS